MLAIGGQINSRLGEQLFNAAVSDLDVVIYIACLRFSDSLGPHIVTISLDDTPSL